MSTIDEMADELLDRATKANNHLDTGFDGADYCGKGRIEELDFSQPVLVIAVGDCYNNNKYRHRIRSLLPSDFSGMLALSEGDLRVIMARFGTRERICFVSVWPEAIKALELVEVLVGSNYVIVDIRHRAADSAIERVHEHGKASLARSEGTK